MTDNRFIRKQWLMEKFFSCCPLCKAKINGGGKKIIFFHCGGKVWIDRINKMGCFTIKFWCGVADKRIRKAEKQYYKIINARNKQAKGD